MGEVANVDYVWSQVVFGLPSAKTCREVGLNGNRLICSALAVARFLTYLRMYNQASARTWLVFLLTEVVGTPAVSFQVTTNLCQVVWLSKNRLTKIRAAVFMRYEYSCG